MRTISIIGKGETWVRAPYDIESWGLTQVLLRRPVSLVIDMNVYEDGRWGERERMEAELTREKCKEQNIPYICLANYPIDEIASRFETDYFSSTVDYAIALALYQGYEELNFYGITLAAPSDYSKLKAGCDFWCGYAKGMGVKVNVHGPSTVMRTPDGLVYGYDIGQGTLL